MHPDSLYLINQERLRDGGDFSAQSREGLAREGVTHSVRAAPREMPAYRVPPAANNVKNEGPEWIEPAA